MSDHQTRGMLQSAMAKVKAVVVRVLVRESEDVGAGVEAGVDYLEQQPDGVEVFQPQGVYFRVPANGEGLGFAPTASASALVCGLAWDRATAPSAGGIGEGEGGLYYAGDFKAFLASDGTLHLGAKTADDWVPCDSKLQDELDRLKSELDAVKTDLTTLKSATASGLTAVGVSPAASGPAGAAAFNSAASAVPTVSPASPGATASATTRVQS